MGGGPVNGLTPGQQARIDDEGERCQACRRAYLTVYDLPDAIWSAITPSAHPHGGLLCPACADERARSVGLLLYWTAYDSKGST
jgi:hypothetical protein